MKHYGRRCQESAITAFLAVTLKHMALTAAQKEDLAFTLLTEAVASELGEDPKGILYKQIFRPQEEMTETLKDYLREHDVTYKDLLPTHLVDKIEKHIDEQWKDLDFSFAELYEHDEGAAHREILGAMGHGVKASDDEAIHEWLEKLGVDPFPTRHLNMDGAYEEARDLMERMSQKPKPTAAIVAENAVLSSEQRDALKQYLLDMTTEAHSQQEAREFMADVLNNGFDRTPYSAMTDLDLLREFGTLVSDGTKDGMVQSIVDTGIEKAAAEKLAEIYNEKIEDLK